MLKYRIIHASKAYLSKTRSATLAVVSLGTTCVVIKSISGITGVRPLPSLELTFDDVCFVPLLVVLLEIRALFLSRLLKLTSANVKPLEVMGFC
uniref:Ovule protein n=1 Tax=Schistosoma curassoni TaxID=6186 RepID=A0A183JJ93_9TREM